jgi:hypothetical protein
MAMMNRQTAMQFLDLRVWRDERLGQLWRVAYNEGDGEMTIGFPDTAALGDFLMERLGLTILDDMHGLPISCASFALEDSIEGEWTPTQS